MPGGFDLAPSGRDDKLTEMEAAAIAQAPKKLRKAAGSFVPKRNVMKKRKTKRT